MLNFNLKYNQCGCENEREHLCTAPFCKTVDCSGNQVIPYGYSGSGIFNPSGNPINNGYINEFPIKYTRPISCKIQADVAGINSSYFSGLNGTHILNYDSSYPNGRNTSFSVQPYSSCTPGQYNDNRWGSHTIRIFISGPNTTLSASGVTDDSKDESFIYNSTSWTGVKPTLWIGSDLKLGSPFGEINFISNGDTGYEYDGDYMRDGYDIFIPEPDCGFNINTGSLDCTNLNLNANLTTTTSGSIGCLSQERLYSILDISLPLSYSIALTSYNDVIDNLEYQNNEHSVSNYEDLSSGYIRPRVIKLNLSNVIDESNITPESNISLQTCDCSGYLNRSYPLNNDDYLESSSINYDYTYSIDFFSKENDLEAKDYICGCNSGVYIDNIKFRFETENSGINSRSVGYVKFYDNSDSIIGTFKKEFPWNATVEYSDLNGNIFSFVSQSPRMSGICDLSSAILDIDVDMPLSSAACEEIETQCNFCYPNNGLVITIPTFTVTRKTDFSEYYRDYDILNQCNSGPTYNAVIDSLNTYCDASYTFPGGEYILSAASEGIYTCTFSYGECPDDTVRITLIITTATTNSYSLSISTAKWIYTGSFTEPPPFCCNYIPITLTGTVTMRQLYIGCDIDDPGYNIVIGEWDDTLCRYNPTINCSQSPSQSFPNCTLVTCFTPESFDIDIEINTI